MCVYIYYKFIFIFFYITKSMFIVKYSFFTQDSADGVPAIGLSDLKFHINSVCRDFGVFETVRCLNAYKYRSNQSSGEIIFFNCTSI